jgi:hypothetical protein
MAFGKDGEERVVVFLVFLGRQIRGKDCGHVSTSS